LEDGGRKGGRKRKQEKERKEMGKKEKEKERGKKSVLLPKPRKQPRMALMVEILPPNS
jgi:hypothetical protein